MTSWTTPRTYTIGEKITKAILDTHVRDNENHLKEQVANRFLAIQDSIPPLSGLQSAAVQLIESSGAGTNKPVIFEMLCDATTDEGRMWVFRCDRAIVSTSLVIDYYMKSANVSAKVKFSAQLAALSAGDASATAKVFASANTSNPTVPDAAGTVASSTVTMTNADSIAEGDWVCLVVQRVPSDTTNDTASGDVAIVGLKLQYA